MPLSQIHRGPFSRIGDRYATFIDSDHFMGRDASSDTWIAPSNSSRNKDGYNLEVALPGFNKEEISIILEGDTLEVSAEKKTNAEIDYLTKEIPTEFTACQFRLPKSVDRDRIQAHYENGILKINLSENRKEKNEKKIEVS